MSGDGRGRPRLAPPRRPGRTAREEILDAAAELFTTQGYTSTSTRRIADAVGIRQASVYHHFATKDDILGALLDNTVDTPLELARELKVGPDAAAPRLHLLAATDVAQLCANRWNLGALYMLPELRARRFEKFRLRRAELRAVYRTLSRLVIAECGGDAGADELPFRLVESVISGRSDDDVCNPGQCWVIADGALRVLGWAGDFEALRRGSAARLLGSPATVSA